MEPIIVQKLIDINQQFYQRFADQFSETRGRLQPGVERIVADLPKSAAVLDIGCGNGELARRLVSRGFEGRYVGLDFSDGLLEHARERLKDEERVEFGLVDLGAPDWDQGLAVGSFDVVMAFAVMHHLPGDELRQRVCRQVRSLLVPGGRFIHSNWQFLNSEKLRQRIHPWAEAGLADEDVDEGDYLLDWRRGGFGLRYAHHYSVEELSRLAQVSGFDVEDSFGSDGSTGDLGLYQVWTL